LRHWFALAFELRSSEHHKSYFTAMFQTQAAQWYVVFSIPQPPNAAGRVKILLKIFDRGSQVDLPVHCRNDAWINAGDAADGTDKFQRSDLLS
jgi:hypothetical protein